MNEVQLQSIAAGLAAKRGLAAKPAGTIVDVNVDYSAVEQFVDTVYDYLHSVYESTVNLESVLSKDQFRDISMAVIAKRVQWVRQRVNGIREGQTIQISNTTALPGPIFNLAYAFGKVESDLGALFLPEFKGLEKYAKQLTVETMRAYQQFVGKLKHYYAFSEGLPSQDTGTWAYLLHVDKTAVGALVSGPSKEGTPNDAYMASVIRCARVLAGFFYGTPYGIIPSPETATVEYIDAFGKGIGE